MSYLPNPDISEAEKNANDGEYYKNAIRGIVNTFTSSYSNRSTWWGQTSSSDGTFNYGNINAELIRNYTYFYGIQPNIDFSFVEQFSDVTAQQNTGGGISSGKGLWTAGNDLSNLIKEVCSTWMRMFDTFEPSCINVSDRVTYLKEDTATKVRMYHDLQNSGMNEEFASQNGGMPLMENPLGDKEFQSHSEIDEYIETNEFKDLSEEFFETIAKKFVKSQDFKYKSVRWLIDILCASYCCSYTDVVDGQVIKKYYHPAQIIRDMSNNTDFGEDDKFFAVIDYFTLPELMEQYDLSADETKYLSDTYGSNSNATIFGMPIVLNWQGGSPKYAVIKGNWIDSCSEEYLKSTDYSGNGRIDKKSNYDSLSERSKDKRKNAETKTATYQVTRQATLIANKYIKNYGIMNNQVRSVATPNKTSMPSKVFCLDQMFGISNSMVSRARQHQDVIDVINFKIKDILRKYEGKIPNFDKALMDYDGLPDIMKDIKTWGATVSDSSKNADLGGQLDTRNSITSVDMSPDFNMLNHLLQERESERKEMSDIFGITDIMKGQMVPYASKGAMEQMQVAGSNANYLLFSKFIHWIDLNISYDVNTIKCVLRTGNEKVRKYWLNAKFESFVDATPTVLLDDIEIYSCINDGLDMQTKARLDGNVLAFIQNGIIKDPLLIFQIEKAKTFNEAERKVRWSMEKQKKEEQKQQKIAILQQLQAGQQQAETAQSVQQTKSDTDLQKVAMQQENENMRHEGTLAQKEMTRKQDNLHKIADVMMAHNEMQNQPTKK